MSKRKAKKCEMFVFWLIKDEEMLDQFIFRCNFVQYQATQCLLWLSNQNRFYQASFCYVKLVQFFFIANAD